MEARVSNHYTTGENTFSISLFVTDTKYIYHVINTFGDQVALCKGHLAGILTH